MRRIKLFFSFFFFFHFHIVLWNDQSNRIRINEARRKLSKFTSMIYKIKICVIHDLLYFYIVYKFICCLLPSSRHLRRTLIPFYYFTSNNLNYISLHDWIQYLQCIYIYVHFKYGRRDRREIQLQKKKIEIDVVSFARYLQPLFRSYANRRHLRAAFKFAPSGLILRKRAGLTNDEGLHTKRSIPPFLRAILLLSAIPIRSLFLLFFPPPPCFHPFRSLRLPPNEFHLKFLTRTVKSSRYTL